MSAITDQMIFVFGSNTGGIHGAGAARFAREQRGAVMGVGFGPIGQSYAIPTKGVIKHRGQKRVGETLPLITINRYVREFLEYADHHQDKEFQVTCIGCGLAGLKDEDIAPMFENAPMNCYFDELWMPWLTKLSHRFWGTF